MLEEKFLGGLLPSHPDYEPFIQAIRTKYKLQEVYPQDEPIQEIYLDDEIVSVDEFIQDVKNQLLENLETIFPEDYVRKYKSAKQAMAFDYQKELEKFDDELKPAMEMFFEFTINASQTVYQIMDANIDETVKMTCGHLLLGDTMEAPQDWFGKVMTMDSGGEKIIIAIASEVTNLDLMSQQIRDAHKKSFGAKQVKITKKTANTAYYLQLLRRNKDRDFILDEFIRLNKFSMPKKNTPRYAQVRNKYWERLKKRLKSAKIILEAIGREKK
jgi:hypothetical protein